MILMRETSGEISFAGKGTSPRAVLSALQGSGSLDLARVKLAAPWPGAIRAAIDAALKSDPESLPAVVKRVLAERLSGGGELSLPDKVKLEITDGRLATKGIAIDTAEGRAHGTAALDLKSLQFESDWRLDLKPASPSEKAPLPGVTVSYRGAFAALAALTPRIESDALERELAVRRMERDVEELERLRRLDEARRREEAERLRRQQLERVPPPPALPVPVAPATPPPRPAAPG